MRVGRVLAGWCFLPERRQIPALLRPSELITEGRIRELVVEFDGLREAQSVWTTVEEPDHWKNTHRPFD